MKFNEQKHNQPEQSKNKKSSTLHRQFILLYTIKLDENKIT